MAFPSRTVMPDPLDVRQVRGLAECELNEVAESPDASKRAVKLGLTLAAGVGVGAMTARLAFGLMCDELAFAWRVGLAFGPAGLVFVWVAHEPHVRLASYVFAAYAFFGLFAYGQSLVFGPAATIRVALPCAAITAVVCGWFVAKQYVYFATANMTQPWEKTLRWRSFWSAVARFRAVRDRPDVTSFRRATLPVVVGLLGGLAMSRSPRPFTSALLGYAVGLVGTALLLWPRGESPLVAVRASLAAVRVFLSYLPNPTLAPGVFQLPTRWLRRHDARLTLGALTLLPLGWAATDLPRVYTAPQKATSRAFQLGAGWVVLGLTDDENDFLNSLGHDDQTDYVLVLAARRDAEARLEYATRKAYLDSLLTGSVAGSVVPAAVFLLTLVSTAGPLLGKFHHVFQEGGQE